MAQGSFYQRRGAAILVVAALLVPLIGWGVQRAILSNSNDVRDWLPAEYPETQQYAWFTEHFGVQDFIVASWPGCTLTDERLDQFVRGLSELTGRDASFQPFSQILTGRSLLDRLAEPPLELDRRLSVARLRGSIVGPDGQQTCAVMTLSRDATARLEPTLGLIRQAAQGVGIPASELRVGGIPVVNAALNRESTASLVRLAEPVGSVGSDHRLALLSGPAVDFHGPGHGYLQCGGRPGGCSVVWSATQCDPDHDGAAGLRHRHLGCHSPVELLSGSSAAWGSVGGTGQSHRSCGAAAGLGGHHDRGGLTLVVLQRATTDPAIRRVFRDWRGDRFADPVHIVACGVRGLDAAASAVSPQRGSGGCERLVAADTVPSVGRLGHCACEPGGDRLSDCDAGHGGRPAKDSHLHPDDAAVLATRPGHSHDPLAGGTAGATIPLEVLLRFSPESDTTMLSRMRLLAAVDTQLRRLPQAGGSLSAATFAPREVTRSIPIRPVQKAVINAKLKKQFDVLHEYGWVARDGDDEIWRISLRIRGIDDLDYSAFTETLRKQVDPLLTEQLGEGHPGLEMTVTGTAPIVFRARRSLLDNMLFGLGTDVVLIVAAVIVTTRSWLTGGVMFVLSVFPTTLVFGAMGLLGIVVDIGSVMTPCVAVGVTVDDVIHFLLCHRRGVQQGLTVPQAANLAYRTCGRAMIQSWGIIGVGLAAFALSSFVPTFRFGMLMLLLLTAGLFGNLLFLPALLAGPIGRWIARVPLALASRVHVSETPES